MKTYKVVITDIAKSQMREYLKYLKSDLKNPQAAKLSRTRIINIAGAKAPAIFIQRHPGHQYWAGDQVLTY